MCVTMQSVTFAGSRSMVHRLVERTSNPHKACMGSVSDEEVHGAWCMGSVSDKGGAWCMGSVSDEEVHGAWCMGSVSDKEGAWCMVHGQCVRRGGAWCMGSVSDEEAYGAWAVCQTRRCPSCCTLVFCNHTLYPGLLHKVPFPRAHLELTRRGDHGVKDH